MDARAINSWFSDHIHDRSVAVGYLTTTELFELGVAIERMEIELKAFEQRTYTTGLDRVTNVTGLVLGLGGPVTIFTPFAPFAIPMTLAGSAISGYQFVRDRQKAMDAEWCEARFVELARLSRDVTAQLRIRTGSPKPP